ncbi:Folylpolyglutamate synthetase [Steccherinum ochraceum]|uniref:Folylpolyglutamate synthase n=1 Tax=Steccherinum ochraceum TaxID=92696 RepID=A0A4R0RHN3_9APHY|nr:Folylpolyglutamate synthetase [Steccherinum ochraceum]
MSTRTYKDAIDCLNTLQSNAATLEASRASGGQLVKVAIPETIEYLGRIGYKPEDLNKLNVIHITGTKGKGSTCAFTDSIIRHAKPEWKVGLFTSPHLIAVRERIRINGAPLPEDDFARFFFEVWDRLGENQTRANPATFLRPMYFKFVTLVAFHAFLSLQVDATILEVGVGGTYDCTNIVPHPVVTAISALGIDHTAVLGKTIPEIAWQKGGIYKEGVPALTVEQPQDGLKVLRERAAEKKASEFLVVGSTPDISDVKLGLAGQHQYQNANLALHAAKLFLQQKANVAPDAGLTETYVKALQEARWPGRCQMLQDPKHDGTTWFLDGAHTVESLDCCMQWFVSPDAVLRPLDTPIKPQRILIFNCTSGRSGSSFLGSMLAKAATQLQLHQSNEVSDGLFDHVIFCTNVTYADGGFKSDLTTHAIADSDLAQLKTQHELASAWHTLVPPFPKERVHVLPSIEHAVTVVREIEKLGKVDVLVAGSLHLVGGTIEVAGLADVAL